MSEQTKNGQGAEPAPPGSREMILSLAGLATLSGILIVVAFQVTLPTIKANKARALRKSVFEVIPEAKEVVTFKLEEGGGMTRLNGEDEKAIKFYAGYTADKRLSGVAIEAQGQGFQDVIKVIYGYSPDKQNVIGMRVLESKETPGLGDKIGFDPHFLSNFDDLDVRLSEDGKRLLRPLEVVKFGARKERWQIDSITGATISSKAIGKLMNRSAQARIPQIVRNLARLKEGQ